MGADWKEIGDRGAKSDFVRVWMNMFWIFYLVGK